MFDHDKYPISAALGLQQEAILTVHRNDQGEPTNVSCGGTLCSSVGTPCAHLIQLLGLPLRPTDFAMCFRRSSADRRNTAYLGADVSADRAVWNGQSVSEFLSLGPELSDTSASNFHDTGDTFMDFENTATEPFPTMEPTDADPDTATLARDAISSARNSVEEAIDKLQSSQPHHSASAEVAAQHARVLHDCVSFLKFLDELPSSVEAKGRSLCDSAEAVLHHHHLAQLSSHKPVADPTLGGAVISVTHTDTRRTSSHPFLVGRRHKTKPKSKS
jgi:hypothetical protein